MSKYSSVFDSQEDQDTKIHPSSTITNVPVLNHFEDDKQKYGSTDSRSDKAVDHKYWLDLLWNAWHLDTTLNSLYYLLHGIRCGGGELTLTKDSFRLLQGEWAEKDWEKVKKENLGPVKDKLISLMRGTRFGKVVEMSDADIPEEWLNGGMVEKEPAKEQGRMFG
jgi:hypothetical protein